MKLQSKVISLALVAAAVLVFSAAYGQQNKFKLKPDAKGKLCLSCHDNFKEKLKNPFVHTPVKTGECSECHNPHTASHGKLLDEEVNKICFKCHEGIISKNPKSSHKIVREGNCVKCHDPHASNNKFLLLKGGNELCFNCHKNIGDAVAKVKFKHNPVEKGCLTCHDPHASAKADHLLKNDLVALCVSCHKTDQPSFAKQHRNYPVAKANCSSCHDPHGSNTGGILFDNAHAPVANKMCGQCHEAPDSPNALRTKRAGFELCRSCHANMMNEAFNKNRVHWPLVDKIGCLNCHEPHASKQKKLLTTEMSSLCGKCHPDTMEKQEKLAELEGKEKEAEAAGKGTAARGKEGAITHNPVQNGECSVCHLPHASDSVYLMNHTSTIEVCGACHEWQKHTSHPIGDKTVDSRNKNLTVQCLSCHRAHGTGNRNLIPFTTISDLCVQCHKQFKR